MDDIMRKLADKKLVKENKRMRKLLREAIDHMEYCGYGDKWERECARDSGMIKRMEDWYAEQDW